MTMLRLVSRGVTLEAADGDAPARTLAGLAVPFDVVARVLSGERVKFLPGSLPVDGPQPKVLRDHDRTHPVGVVVDRVAAADGIHVRARISSTAAGDEVLTLAADGVLDAWSVGADPTDFVFERDDAGDVMVIRAADWQELSVLPFGAFPTARVTSVTAAPATEEEPAMSTTEAAPALVAATVPDPPSIITPRPTAPAVQGAPGHRPGTYIRPGSLTLGGIAQLVASANRGELSMDQAKAGIQAALTNVITGDVPAAVMPAHINQILDLVDHGRPTINAISNAPLPPSGMQVEYPKWTTAPTVGQQTTQKTAITSTAATMGLGTANVVTFAGGNDISLQTVERSSPSFLEAYLKAMAVDYAKKTDAYVIAALLAAAAAVTPPAGTAFIDRVAALIGALVPASVPAGPLVLGVSWDQAATLINVPATGGPAFWSGSISFGSTEPTVSTGGGLNIFVDPNLPAKTYLLGARDGATWYENAGAPADVRVVDVSLLGLDVGVYGFGALTIPWPGSWQKMTVP